MKLLAAAAAQGHWRLELVCYTSHGATPTAELTAAEQSAYVMKPPMQVPCELVAHNNLGCTLLSLHTPMMDAWEWNLSCAN